MTKTDTSDFDPPRYAAGAERTRGGALAVAAFRPFQTWALLNLRSWFLGIGVTADHTDNERAALWLQIGPLTLGLRITT